MIIIEILLTFIKYCCYFTGIYFGGYTFVGALYFWRSPWATEDDTFIKCIKKAWKHTIRMEPWFVNIED